ncbi:MAG: hypothetical protein LBU34_17185 [Planctomycetaceae bacterium]|nr:hypothetical protein [Planctomycetaceae bacterium]
MHLFSQVGNSSPILRLKIHKVGNRWVKAPRRTITSVIADKFLFPHGNRNLNPAWGVMCITGGEAQRNRRITPP